jgi:hypothetical protein
MATDCTKDWDLTVRERELVKDWRAAGVTLEDVEARLLARRQRRAYMRGVRGRMARDWAASCRVED